jgi:hypothetical protein
MITNVHDIIIEVFTCIKYMLVLHYTLRINGKRTMKGDFDNAAYINR